jgi:uncharacterized protein
MDFQGARDYITARLRNELKPDLYYHSPEHTLDVHHAAVRLIKMEGIDSKNGVLIETATMYHDAGMLFSYRNHEEASCKIAGETLPGFGYSSEDVQQVCNLIIVTKLPQITNSIYEQIICDADLDPLGREDYFINAFRLKLEWEVNGIMKCSLKEWIALQIEFLEGHSYFTKSEIQLRLKQKTKNLSELKDLLK